MKTPLVSIIMPTYNHEKYIGECIESVLSQTFPDWEQIIIDDASTDRTPEIVEQYAKKDKRIKFIRHKKNYGIYRLADTYNEALNISNGELIAVLEGDDFWPEYKLEKQVPVFDDKDVVLSWGKVGVTTEEGKVWRITPKKFSKREEDVYSNFPVGNILKILLFKNIIPASSVVVRKNSLISIKGFQQPPGISTTDYFTWLYLSFIGKFKFVNTVLGYWRQSLLQVTKTSYFLCMIEQLSEIKKDFYVNIPIVIKNRIKISKDTFIQKSNFYNAEAYFNNGRIMLIKGKWSEARNMFEKAFILGNNKTKLKAFVGWIFSVFRFDIEYIFYSFNKTNLLWMKNKKIFSK